MKHFNLQFLLLLITFFTYGQTSAPKDDYEIVRQDEKVFLYEHWADFPGTK
jgi:hypothetical protein